MTIYILVSYSYLLTYLKDDTPLPDLGRYLLRLCRYCVFIVLRELDLSVRFRGVIPVPGVHLGR